MLQVCGALKIVRYVWRLAPSVAGVNKVVRNNQKFAVF